MFPDGHGRGGPAGPDDNASTRSAAFRAEASGDRGTPRARLDALRVLRLTQTCNSPMFNFLHYRGADDNLQKGGRMTVQSCREAYGAIQFK